MKKTILTVLAVLLVSCVAFAEPIEYGEQSISIAPSDVYKISFGENTTRVGYVNPEAPIPDECKAGLMEYYMCKRAGKAPRSPNYWEIDLVPNGYYIKVYARTTSPSDYYNDSYLAWRHYKDKSNDNGIAIFAEDEFLEINNAYLKSFSLYRNRRYLKTSIEFSDLETLDNALEDLSDWIHIEDFTLVDKGSYSYYIRK